MSRSLNKTAGFLESIEYTHAESNSTIAVASIRWCNKILTWHMLSCTASDGGQSIDVTFDDESFSPLTSAEEGLRRDLQTTLKDCNITNHVQLSQLLSLLLHAYKEHNHTKLSGLTSSRLQFELGTLPQDTLELFLGAKGAERTMACISIPLWDTDWPSKLQLVSLVGEDPSSVDTTFKLHAKYNTALPQSEPEVSLEVPAVLQPYLGKILLPAWTPQMVLMDFVPLTSDRVRQQLEQQLGTLTARSQLINALSSFLGTPLEVCLVAGTAMWPLVSDAQTVLVVMTIGPKFPEEKPSLMLGNSRLMGIAPEKSKTYTDYRWSPRWSPLEMSSRIAGFLCDEVTAFGRATSAVTK